MCEKEICKNIIDYNTTTSTTVDQKKNHLMLELMKVIAGHMWMSVRELCC